MPGVICLAFPQLRVVSTHFDKFVEENGFVLGSEEYDQMMLIAGWMLDAIDPQSYTPYLKNGALTTSNLSP